MLDDSLHFEEYATKWNKNTPKSPKHEKIQHVL